MNFSTPTPILKKYTKTNDQRFRLIARSEFGDQLANEGGYQKSVQNQSRFPPKGSTRYRYKQTNLWRYFRRKSRYRPSEPSSNWQHHSSDSDRRRMAGNTTTNTTEALIAALDSMCLMES